MNLYKISDITFSVVILVASFVLLHQLKELPTDAKMFPNILLYSMAFLSILMLIRAAIGRSQKVNSINTDTWTFFGSKQKFYLSILVFSIYLFVIPYIGFFSTSFCFFIIIALLANYTNIKAIIFANIGFLVFIYLLFVLFLDRPLPKELIFSYFKAG